MKCTKCQLSITPLYPYGEGELCFNCMNEDLERFKQLPHKERLIEINEAFENLEQIRKEVNFYRSVVFFTMGLTVGWFFGYLIGGLVI